MDKMLAVGKCKLANQTLSTYYNNVYGIRCGKEDILSKWLHLFLWAYENTCLVDNDDCTGGNLCNLKNIIGKITKHCKDCRPKKYKEAVITINPDYTCWYQSQEYIDCLTIQLEEEGYIETIINLCANLNPEITITPETICGLIIHEITANGLTIDEAYQKVINNL